MTDTTTDQTRTQRTTDPVAEATDPTGTADSTATADPMTETRPAATGGRTADEIVAERDAARTTGRDAGAAPLSTADIASGGTTAGAMTGAGSSSDGSGGLNTAGQVGGRAVDGERVAPLFDDAATTDLRDRWTDVQAGFVDEPRSSVERADALVAEVMKRLADSFATERKALEQQWSRGDDVSTEDLRVALRRYRSFFDRLLSF